MTKPESKLDELRLLEYLDGKLPDAERSAVEKRLAKDEEARKLVAEHRAVWDLLDDAMAADVSTSESFRRQTVERARTDTHDTTEGSWRNPATWRRAAAVAAAAALVVMVTGTWMSNSRSRYVVTDAERPIIGHLELLDHLDFLREHGDSLDLVNAWHRTSALDGEVDLGEGR